MKRIVFTITTLAFAFSSFAQIPGKAVKTQIIENVPKKNLKKTLGKTNATSKSIYIDYDYGESIKKSASYERLRWSMNTRGDEFLLYSIVAFDSIYDMNENKAYNKNDITKMTIDSIYTAISHKNTSGMQDTIVCKIIALSVTGYPTNTVLWSDTIYTSVGLSKDNNLVNTASISFYPQREIAIDNNNHFGVRLEYYGPKEDTLNIVAGFVNNGPCANIPVSAIKSIFAPNSYALWSEHINLGILPKPNGEDMYYDCDNNQVYEEEADGENFLQNIAVASFLTIETKGDGTGIEQETATKAVVLEQNQPNPFSGISTISYTITKPVTSVSFTIYDIMGKKVKEINEGMKNVGKHQLQVNSTDFKPGVYFYTLTIDGISSFTKKMAVKE